MTTTLRTADEVLAKQLMDPEFRAYWERMALARAVALRLTTYRAEHGLTQTQLARKLGMKQSAVARLEMGEHAPKIDTLVRISEALGIEFMVNIKPTPGKAPWAPPKKAEQAKVVERVPMCKGGELLVAAS
jgi:ribosome-binding protein aMBF1 (putative translation factor)